RRSGRGGVLHPPGHDGEHPGAERPSHVPEAQADARDEGRRPGPPPAGRDAAHAGHVPELPARAAPRRPGRLGRQLPASGRDPAPRQPDRRARQGRRRADRRSAGELGMTDAAFADNPDPLDEPMPEAEAPALSERVLNQDEIDSLLVFDLGDDDGSDRTGIRALINSALVSYERLRMLEIVFDRLVRLMTTSLRNFTSDNVEVSLDNISSIRFG